jgi:hypothetical protein
MVDLTAPPRDPVFAGCVGEPEQQIAMACERRAKTDEVEAAQLVQCAQQMMLIAQPPSIFCDDGRTIAVRAHPERIAPFAAAADVDGTCGNAWLALVEDPAHRYRRVIFPLRRRGRGTRFGIRVSRIAEGEAETACPLTCEPPRPDPTHRSGIRSAMVPAGFSARGKQAW